MPRFDLYHGTGRVDYYLDMQADFHAYLGTRIVIPVLAAHKVTHINRRLMVALDVAGQTHYAVAPMMAAIAAHTLGPCIGNASGQSPEILAAVDFLLKGF